MSRTVQPQAKPQSPASIKHLIAVASGKGGVGKSTVAVNLSLALQAQGFAVGILDADIYGPSQPHMLGVSGQPAVADNKFIPLQSHGLVSMSIGYLVDPDTAAIWRGPIVTRALMQLLNDTAWPKLDYLIIDLPPGTGDVQLTLAQKVALTGVVIVSTPQDVALLDVQKAWAMFEKVKVKTLGVVENMSLHTCSACGHQEPVFGTSGAETFAAKQGINFFGRLPLDARICQHGDTGTPTVVREPNGEIATAFADIASQLVGTVAALPKNYSQHFAKVVVEYSGD